MWSNKIPAEWNDDTGDLSLRLKRNALNLNGGYEQHPKEVTRR